MKSEKTLVMVKPDGVKKKLIGECIRRIENSDLEIIDIKMFRMSKKLAHDFRKDVKKKHPAIYDSLIDYMTEGNMIAMIVYGDNATAKLKEIIGPTNPRMAKKGTIRGDYGEEDLNERYGRGEAVKNIIHCSGDLKEAREEIKMIFG